MGQPHLGARRRSPETPSGRGEGDPVGPASGDTLLLFAKRPEAGRVKTRLCPPWSHEKAAQFYTCLLEDTLEATAAFAKTLNAQAVLCLDPLDESPQALPFAVPALFSVEAQRGSGLAARMENAVGAAFERGARRVLLRGSDTPMLSRAHFEEALVALEEHDFVLSPDCGGGYGLVGFSRLWPGLLDLPMSTDTVCADTLARARDWGLRTARIEPCFDVDRWPDLSHLRRASRGVTGSLCPRTLAFLEAAIG